MDEQPVGDPLESLYKVKQELAVLVSPEGGGLGASKLSPRRRVRPPLFPGEQVVAMVIPLPLQRDLFPCPHPNPDEHWQQADRPESPVGLGQQDDDDNANRGGPRTGDFASIEYGHKDLHGVVREPVEGSGVDPIPSQPGDFGEGAGSMQELLRGERGSADRDWGGALQIAVGC